VYKLLYTFFNLPTLVIGQRSPELSPLRIRWSLFSSGPLTHCRIIMLAIHVDPGLLALHPFSCFVEFRPKTVIHCVALVSPFSVSVRTPQRHCEDAKLPHRSYRSTSGAAGGHS
jgi:hypothetical protein